MVARPGQYQPSFNAGELAPDVQGNTALKSYYAGARRMLNVLPVPQGGFRLAPRTRRIGRVRRALSQVYSGSAPATLILAAGSGYTFDLGSNLVVSAVSFDVYATIAQSARVLCVEALDVATGAWRRIGSTYPISLNATGRRVAFEPGVSVTARYVRVILASAIAGACYLNVTSLRVYREASSGAPEHRLFSFTKSSTLAYLAVMTDGHVDFWIGGAWAGCAGHSIVSADLSSVDVVQRDETAFVLHQNYATTRLIRHGADYDWSFESTPWIHVPTVQYDATYSDQSEEWLVSFRWPTTSFNPVGFQFILSVDGDTPAPITLSGTGSTIDMAATASAIKTALESLAGVETGIAVNTGPLVTGYAEFRVVFSGAGNAGVNFDVSGEMTTSTEMSLRAVRLTRGTRGGEPLFSSPRGYAAAGMFYQDRLLTGGFKAKQSALIASRPGEYFDLNIELQSAAAAILANLDTDGDESLIHFARGRHPVIFTTAAHYYVADRALSATNPPNIVRSETIGASRRVKPIEQAESLIYVNDAESLLYQMSYDDVAQGYRSSPLSLLSSHLVRAVSCAALSVASEATDADLVYLTRDDGGMTIAALIRGQDVSAFADWRTDGLVRRVAVDGAQRVHITVERNVGGTGVLFLEQLDDNMLVDCAITQTRPLSTLVSGIADHEGAAVWAIADGWPAGPFTVTGGAITLPFAASSVTVGRWTPPVVETLPFPRVIAERQVLQRPARIHTVRADVIETQSIAIGANDGAARDVPTLRGGGPVDQPPEPVTREIVVTGLAGFSRDGTAVFTQTRPGALHVRNITLEARI